MPELPEVESVRRSLAARILERRVKSVDVCRADVVTGDATPAALLSGRRIGAIHRHGKQLALVAAAKRGEKDPPCICVHLGMSGSLRVFGPSETGEPSDAGSLQAARHCHVSWHFDHGSRLVFRDPRRFGGIWTYTTVSALRSARWDALGQDALTITPRALARLLARSSRPIKAALLDQGLVAGMGNIYVDEALFRAGLHPLRPCNSITTNAVHILVKEIRTVLRRSIKAGGSTLRDYVDGTGKRGGFQARHAVYGRAGKSCSRCGAVLQHLRVGGRATVYCPDCQSLNL